MGGDRAGLALGCGPTGKRWADHRRVLEGIVWRFRVGAPWRDLPADFGPWQTVWKRHYRWSTDGTYAKMFLTVQEAFGSSSAATDTLVSVLSVDSTSIRAHQHAAGARLHHYAAEAVDDITDPELRGLLTRYARWHVVGRAKTSRHGQINSAVAGRCKGDIQTAMGFFDHLAAARPDPWRLLAGLSRRLAHCRPRPPPRVPPLAHP